MARIPFRTGKAGIGRELLPVSIPVKLIPLSILGNILAPKG